MLLSSKHPYLDKQNQVEGPHDIKLSESNFITAVYCASCNSSYLYQLSTFHSNFCSYLLFFMTSHLFSFHQASLRINIPFNQTPFLKVSRLIRLSRRFVEEMRVFYIVKCYPFLYCLTKISIRAKRSISRVFSLFIVPSPFFIHCPYKGRINRAESVLTGLKQY